MNDNEELRSFLQAALYLIRETGNQMLHTAAAYEQTDRDSLGIDGKLLALIRQAGFQFAEIAERFAKDAGMNLNEFGEEDDDESRD